MTGTGVLPPYVYVPTVTGGPVESRAVELVLGTDGERMLLCYSAPDRLRAFYGASSWVVFPAERVPELAEHNGATHVFVDRSFAGPGEAGQEPPPDPDPPRDPASWPPVVYVPTDRDGPSESRRVELFRTHDGRVALLCYSTVDRLQRWLAADQPWAPADRAALNELREYVGYDLALLDAPLNEAVDLDGLERTAP